MLFYLSGGQKTGNLFGVALIQYMKANFNIRE